MPRKHISDSDIFSRVTLAHKNPVSHISYLLSLPNPLRLLKGPLLLHRCDRRQRHSNLSFRHRPSSLTMPGIHKHHTDSHRSSGRVDGRVRTHPPSVNIATGHESQSAYKPPYSFQQTTTAYGLNEPQWSIGPPPIRFEASPYYRVPLPSQPPINIHSLLRNVGGEDTNRVLQPIVWYVNQPSSSARISSSSAYANPYHWRTLPAASPVASSAPPSSITIRVASAPSFTRPIVVFPSNAHSGVITIADVLNAVHYGLRQNANDVLCETMGIVPSLMTAQVLHGSNAAPSTLSQGGSDDEVGTHIARCLSFHTLWAGLSPSPYERDVWILHTKPITPS